MKKLLFFVTLFATFGIAQAQEIQGPKVTKGRALPKLAQAQASTGLTKLQPAPQAQGTQGSEGLIGLQPAPQSQGAQEVDLNIGNSISVKLSDSQPFGSYRETCTDIKFDGSTLTATCQDRNKKDVASSLSGVSKKDYIINDNGVLVVVPNYIFKDNGDGTGNFLVVPEGSYIDTCTNIRYDGSNLKATCKDDAQKDVEVSLSLENLWYDAYILNMNGNLVVAPKGSYTKTCKDIRLRDKGELGLSLTARCQTDDPEFADEDGYRGSPLFDIKEGDFIINDNGKLTKVSSNSALKKSLDAPPLPKDLSQRVQVSE